MTKIKLLLLSLLILGCSKNKNYNKENRDKIIGSNKIVITGVSDDPKALDFTSFINHSYMFGQGHKDFKKNIINDSLKLELDSIFETQLMDVWSFTDTSYFHSKVLLSPGDSISFEIVKGVLEFKGDNAIHNNFYGALNIATQDYAKVPYEGNIYEYKKKVKSIYKEKLDFLNKYVSKNQITSTDFIYKIKADFKHHYLGTLLNPRIDKVEGYDFYTSRSLLSILEQNHWQDYNNKEIVFDMSDYFDNVSIMDFKTPDLLSNSFFKNNINQYIRDYFDSSGHLDYSKDKLLAEKEIITQNFDGELENYAIARMIRDYNKKGFGHSINNIEFMKALIDEYKVKFKNPTYREEMIKIREELETFDFNLSEAALNSKLISPIGDTLTLKEIFNRSSKRIRVIDFWASWCIPCIAEIKKAKSFKDKLSIEENVEWIYLSIDKDKEKWLKKSTALKEFLNIRNQYVIVGGISSSLARSLKVREIPRYVIFNKKNQVVLHNSPRPSDSLIFKRVIDNIK